MFGLSPTEMMIVLVIAVLLFGSRLPSVARSLGKSFMEFKRGVRGIEDEFNEAIHAANRGSSSMEYDDMGERVEPTAPKFEPPPAASADEVAEGPAASQDKG